MASILRAGWAGGCWLVGVLWGRGLANGLWRSRETKGQRVGYAVIMSEGVTTVLKPYLEDIQKTGDVRELQGLTHSPLSDFPTLITLASHDEYTFILQAVLAMAIRQLRKRRMRLHKY